MAKFIVKAVKYKNQFRITLPVLLVKNMEWKDVVMFTIQKKDKETAEIRALYRKRDLS